MDPRDFVSASGYLSPDRVSPHRELRMLFFLRIRAFRTGLKRMVRFAPIAGMYSAFIIQLLAMIVDCLLHLY